MDLRLTGFASLLGEDFAGLVAVSGELEGPAIELAGVGVEILPSGVVATMLLVSEEAGLVMILDSVIHSSYLLFQPS